MSYLIGSMTIGRFVGTIFLLLAEIPYSKPFKVVNLWQRTLATNSWSAYLGIRYLVSYWNEMDVSDWCFVSHPAKRLRQGMDVESDPVSHNLLSEIGFLKGLELTLRLMAFALFFGGLPCKSYTFISSATHQRSAVQPNGNPFPFVIEGSTLLCRWSIMALIAVARGAVWMLEHPDRTTVDLMPSFQALMPLKLKPLMVRWFLSQWSFHHVLEFSKLFRVVVPFMSWVPQSKRNQSKVNGNARRTFPKTRAGLWQCVQTPAGYVEFSTTKHFPNLCLRPVNGEYVLFCIPPQNIFNNVSRTRAPEYT
jgi:hypothetical protein